MKNTTKTTNSKVRQKLTAKVMLAIAGVFLLSTVTTQAALQVIDITRAMDKAIGIRVVNKANNDKKSMVVRGKFTNLFSDKQLTVVKSGSPTVEVAPQTTSDKPEEFLVFVPNISIPGTKFTYEVSIPLVKNGVVEWRFIWKIDEKYIYIDHSVPGITACPVYDTSFGGTNGILLEIYIRNETYLPINE